MKGEAPMTRKNEIPTNEEITTLNISLSHLYADMFIPSNITNVNVDIGYCVIGKIIFASSTPPTGTLKTGGASISVPKGAKQAYVNWLGSSYTINEE